MDWALTFAKRMQVCCIREMMRPLHVTYGTGRDRTLTQGNSLERTHIPWLLLSIPYFLSLKFRSQTNPASGSEEPKKMQQHQPATYNLSFWGEQQIKFSIINWDDGMHSISVNSSNSNEPLISQSIELPTRRISTGWRNRWIETSWSSEKAEAYAWDGKSMSGIGWGATVQLCCRRQAWSIGGQAWHKPPVHSQQRSGVHWAVLVGLQAAGWGKQLFLSIHTCKTSFEVECSLPKYWIKYSRQPPRWLGFGLQGIWRL